MAGKINHTQKIISSALKLTATKPWAEISMKNIADAAGIKTDILMQYFSSKLSILDAFNRQLDQQSEQYIKHSLLKGSIRDDLFDILMARFDALQPHKLSLNEIYTNTVPFDPLASICGLRSLLISMQSILELVGIEIRSPIGYLKMKVLSAIFFRSFLIWLKDDSVDMAKTMASLNGDLTKIEILINKCQRHSIS